jgi:hypothetical protein
MGVNDDEKGPLVEKEFTEAEMDAILRATRPIIREEVQLQLTPLRTQMGSIEAQAKVNGEQQQQGRIEIAGLVGLFTAVFGTDGLGGTLGILVRNAVADAKRANELAHATNGNVELLVNRGWIKKEMADEKSTARATWVKWGVGILTTVGLGKAALWLNAMAHKVTHK